MDEILIALKTFIAHVNGKNVLVRAGQTVRLGHPLLEGRLHLFASINDRVDFDVQVTRTPPPPPPPPPPKIVPTAGDPKPVAKKKGHAQ